MSCRLDPRSARAAPPPHMLDSASPSNDTQACLTGRGGLNSWWRRPSGDRLRLRRGATDLRGDNQLASMRASAAARASMATETALFTVNRYRLLRNAVIALFGVALLAGAVAIETHIFDPGTSDHRNSDVRLVSDGSIVSGATSTFVRSNEGVDFTLNTTGLPAGHVIIVKALIFNQPLSCTHGASGRRCGGDDIGAAGVQGSIVFARGFVLRQTGAVSVTGHIGTDDRTRALVGDGLTNPHGADVHLVVVDHGPPITGLYNDQLSTIGGGCKDAPPGGGAPGANTCADLQVAANEVAGN